MILKKSLAEQFPVWALLCPDYLSLPAPKQGQVESTIISHVVQTRKMGTEFDELAQGHTAGDGALLQIQAAWIQRPYPDFHYPNCLHTLYLTCIGTSVPLSPSHSPGLCFSGCDALCGLPGHLSLGLPGDAALLTLLALGSPVSGIGWATFQPQPCRNCPCLSAHWSLLGLPRLLRQRMAKWILRGCMNGPQRQARKWIQAGEREWMFLWGAGLMVPEPGVRGCRIGNECAF